MSPGDYRNQLAAALGATADCLQLDDLEQALDGRKGEDARRNMEAHVAGCVHCRTGLALLREFDSGAIRPEERRDVSWVVARLRRRSPEPAWWNRLWRIRIMMPAAALAAAILLVVGLQLRRPVMEPVPYSPGADVMRSQSLKVIAPVGDIATPPQALEWQAVAGATHYRVRVLEVDRSELWSTTTSQQRIVLPKSVLRSVAPLKTILWEITAVDTAGNVLASSGLQHFRLAPSAQG